MPRKREPEWTPWKVNGRIVGYQRGGIYYIDRSIAGRRVRISTACVTPEAAAAEYERFEVSPGTFVSRLGKRAMPRRADPARAEQLRRNHHSRAYKITPAEWDALVVAQGGRCAICGTLHADTRRGELEVDHCHATGEVRGLLCGPCNRGIGSLGDSVDLLRKAVAYLERAPSVPRQPVSDPAGTERLDGIDRENLGV